VQLTIRSTGILPVRLRGIGILPMIQRLEGLPNAEFYVADPKSMAPSVWGPQTRKTAFGDPLSPVERR
jgi:hypothetical protein